MVALGFKVDYAKDVLFNLLNVAWMMYGFLEIFRGIFSVAGELDKDISCVFNESTPIGRAIKGHCVDKEGVGFVIPPEIFDSERFWFDFLTVLLLVVVVVHSLVFLVVQIRRYVKLFKEDQEEERHRLQTEAANWRSQYMIVSSSCLMLMLLVIIRMMNKISAFGQWQHVDVSSELSSLAGRGMDVIGDSENWDTETLLPDTSSLFKWIKPAMGDPRYLGCYVHNFAVFMTMTLTKNIFMAVVTALTDDLHVVSLLLASVPAGLLALLLWFPYMSAILLFKNADYHYAMRFEFDFGAVQQVAVYGGLVGFNLMPLVFLRTSMYIMEANNAYEDWLSWEMEKVSSEVKEGSFEPPFINRPYFVILRQYLGEAAGRNLLLLLPVGLVGMPCLVYVSVRVGEDSVWAPFRFCLLSWAAAFSAFLALALWHRRAGVERPSRVQAWVRASSAQAYAQEPTPKCAKEPSLPHTVEREATQEEPAQEPDVEDKVQWLSVCQACQGLPGSG